MILFQTLCDFQYVEAGGKDQGINVRKKAQSLVGLLSDKEKIREVRNKAASNRDKCGSAPSVFLASYFGLVTQLSVIFSSMVSHKSRSRKSISRLVAHRYRGVSSTGAFTKSSSYSSTGGGYGGGGDSYQDDDRYGASSRGARDDDRYGDRDRDRDDRYKDDRYKDDRYKDDRYRDDDRSTRDSSGDRYRDDRDRERFEDDRYGPTKPGDGYGNDKYGDDSKNDGSSSGYGRDRERERDRSFEEDERYPPRCFPDLLF